MKKFYVMGEGLSGKLSCTWIGLDFGELRKRYGSGHGSVAQGE